MFTESGLNYALMNALFPVRIKLFVFDLDDIFFLCRNHLNVSLGSHLFPVADEAPSCGKTVFEETRLTTRFEIGNGQWARRRTWATTEGLPW